MNKIVASQIEKANLRLNAGCFDCQMQSVCFKPEYNNLPLDMIELKKGEKLFAQQSSQLYVYHVRSGCIKASALTRDGSEQVMGFYFSEDTLGLDGISKGEHRADAVALKTSIVCRIPITLFSSNSDYASHLLNLMSQEYKSNKSHASLINGNCADVRISTLLLNLANRFCDQVEDGLRFNLPMTRADIANYLGLTGETVSRRMKKMENDGVVKFSPGSIKIIALQKLQEIAFE